MAELVGQRVAHKKFGVGVVVAAETSGSETKLTIRFGPGEEKTLLARFVDVLPAAVSEPASPVPTKPDDELLAAVLASPHDLAARRTHGERLASQGDPLGDLILTQLALSESLDPDARATLEQRERGLLREHYREWEERFRLRGCAPRFRYGLIDHLGVGVDPIVGWERALDLHPIESLEVGALAHLQHASKRVGARRLKRLVFRAFRGGEASIVPLARVPLSLAELDVRSLELHADSLAKLVAAQPALEALTLSHPPQPVATPIAVPPPAPKLRRLCLFDWRTGPALASTLAEWEAMRDLVDLDLGSCDLGDAGARVLATIPFARLERLELRANGIGPEGVAALVAAPFAPGLRALGLENNPLGPAGATHLTAAGLGALGQLDLAWTSLDDAGLEELCDGSLPSQVEVLSLYASGLGPSAAAVMAARAWPKLRKLVLSLNALSDDGVESLCRAAMPSLRELELRKCEISDRGADALVRATAWTALRRLDLSENRFGLDAAEALSGALALRNVEHLSLFGVGLSPEDERRLSRRG